MTETEAPEGFALRVASLDDATPIADLINEVNMTEAGFPWTTETEIRGELTTPGRDPDNDLVLIDAAGRLAAYLSVSVDSDQGAIINQLAWTHPRYWGRGLSAWLLRLGEQRASAIAGPFHERSAVLHVACWATNDAARRLFAQLGYAYARTFHEMRRTLGDRPETAEPPVGIAIRPFVLADAQGAHAALVEAFADHWGETFHPFDRWVHDHIEGDGAGFDPALWFVALVDEEIVGAICTRAHVPSTPDTASVDMLGVRRPWRSRGVARALLLSAFDAVERRGIGAIELGVDSSNPTGATRLYESVGMHVVRSFEIWEKELRA
jgi:mycothiol synthase